MMLEKLNKKSDEDTIRMIKESQSDYLSMNKDRLILFAIGFLESKDIEPTFDKIVVTGFKLFPKKFSLIGFPEYPDGRTIYYCVYNHCTLTNKWLRGNIQSGFKVTEKGKYFLDETKKMLVGKIKLSKTYGIVPKRKEVTFITALKKTKTFKKFVDDMERKIPEFEIFEVLNAPMDSKELAQAHLEKYFEYANRINDLDALNFLEFLKEEMESEKIA